MVHTIPAGNWSTALANAIRDANPGDIIEVDSATKVELARRAMERMNVRWSNDGVTVQTAQRLEREAKP